MFTNVIDLSTGIQVARHIFVNNCLAYKRLHLKRGDVVQLTAVSEFYRNSKQYHRANVYRGIRNDYRLKYPKDVVIIKHIETEERHILNLRNMQVYKTFNDYIMSLPNANIITKEDVGFIYIQLWDLDYTENIFNRKQKIINPNYMPNLIHADKWDSLTEEQQAKILEIKRA